MFVLILCILFYLSRFTSGITFDVFVTNVEWKRTETMQNVHSFWPDRSVEFIPSYLTKNVEHIISNLFSTKLLSRNGFSTSYKERVKTGLAYRMQSDAFTVACSFTHRRAWQLIAERKQQYTLILEGDAIPHKTNVHVDETLMNIIERVNIMDPTWDIIQLGRCWDICGKDQYLYTSSSYSIVKSLSPLCTHAYLISTSGAEKLLVHSLPYQTAVDSLITTLGRAGYLQIYSTTPRLFDQKRDTKSSHDTDVTLPECEPRSTILRWKNRVFGEFPWEFDEKKDRAISTAFDRHWSGSQLGQFCPYKTTYQKHIVDATPCDYESLKQMCKLITFEGTTEHRASRQFISKSKRLGLRGFVVWGYSQKTMHSHRYIHESIYKNFVDAAKSSLTPMHVCWIDPSQFSSQCSLSLLFDYDDDSQLGKSLVFTSPKHFAYEHDPTCERLPNEADSFYIFHEQIPYGFKRNTNVIQWIVRGPDGSLPLLESQDFVLRYNFPRLNKQDNPVIPPNTYVAPWATIKSPSEFHNEIL